MKEVLNSVAEISKKYEQLDKISGSGFNIFDVINVTTDEVRLHSRFIAELLNPKGSHGQDDLFLKLFTSQLDIELETESAVITVEKHIGPVTDTTGGYLDIYILDAKGKSITIENKIYAPDQENQLLRYYNFSPNNLLYLNLYGELPSESSYKLPIEKRKGQLGKTEIELTDFTIITYETEIKNWLTACRKEAVELPLLREGITHYLNLIKILTGQSANNKMNTEIRDYIASSANNLKQAALIGESMINAKVKIQWLFWQSLKEKMESNNLQLVEKDNVSKQNVNNYYTKTRNRDKYYGFWVKIFEKENLSIHFGIELDNRIYFGFTIEENGKGGISNQEKFSSYVEKVKAIHTSYTNNQSWLGWRHTKQNLNFRAFNSDAIFNLADRNKLDQTTTEIANDILTDIKALKTKLENI